MWNTSLVPRRKANRELSPFGSGARGFERLFDELWQGVVAPMEGAAGFSPRMNLEETESEIRVSLELPGLEEKDFEVSLEGDLLSIRGEKRDERRDETGTRRHVETVYGRFHRTVRLPFEADADAVKASFRQGVLEIAVPRPEEARPHVRAIPVTTA